MKTRKLMIIVMGSAFMICSMTLYANPMSTGFTYQGRLLENGQPGTGTYDLQCKLFDAKENGTQIGETLVFEDGSSPDGYFTVEIDFGVEVFSGEARYLEMAFRPWDSTNPNDFVVLADRVELTPTPYALQTRGIYVDPNMLVGIGTTDLTDAQLKIETTQKYGIHVKSQVTDGSQWGIQASAEGSTTGDSYGVRGAGSSPIGNNTGLWGWARQPSTGDNIGVYGIASNDGTGDAFAGYFTWAKTYFEKEVGIGTTTPRTDLEILGSTGLRVNPGYNSTVFGDFKHAVSGGLIINSNAGGGGWADISLQTNGTTKMFIESGGNVGIGTTSPSEKLDVDGNIHTSGNITKAYTAGTSNLAVPIAYGFIGFDGAIRTSTPNVTSVVWSAASSRYEITISGESYDYDSYVTIVTLDGFSGMPITGSSSGILHVYIRKPDDTGYKQSNFQFITYKP